MGFDLLLRNWKIIALAAVLAAVAFYVMLLRSNITTLEADNKVLAAELSVSKASVKSLSAAIDEQNAATERVRQAAAEKEKLYLAEIARAKALTATLRQQAGDIMKRQPPQGVSKCDAANNLISEEIARAKK